MWLNAQIEKSWGELFKYDNKDKVVILNPGKRKRYTEHEGDIARESISLTLDSISGGDARFNRVSELPTFEIRTDWFAHTYFKINPKLKFQNTKKTISKNSFFNTL